MLGSELNEENEEKQRGGRMGNAKREWGSRLRGSRKQPQRKMTFAARARTLNRFQIIIIWDRDSLSDLILSWESLEQAIGVFMDFDFVMLRKNAEENMANI